MKSENINEKLLNKDQIYAVRSQIVGSLREGFLKSNQMVPDNFEEVSYQIADNIIHKAQMALGQTAVFDKILKKEKTPISNYATRRLMKIGKKVLNSKKPTKKSKVALKTKKHVRK